MESTFKKKYESVTTTDGSLEISLKGKKFGAHQLSGATGLIAMLFIISPFILGFISMWLLQDINGKYWMIHVFMGLLGPVSVIYFFFIKKNTSKIIANKDGIIFGNGKKRLARKDINNFGVMTETVTGSGYTETAYVYANALGQRIALTGHMEQALASSISNELQNYYN